LYKRSLFDICKEFSFMHRLQRLALVLALGTLSACGTTPATPDDTARSGAAPTTIPVMSTSAPTSAPAMPTLAPTAQPEPVAQPTSAPAATADQQTDAILAAAEKALEAVRLSTPGRLHVQQVEGDYARVQWMPNDPNATDPSYIFVQRTNGAWKPIAGPGTAFMPEDLQPYGVPQSLWLDAPQPITQNPQCDAAQTIMEQTLKVSATVVVTDVLDPQTNANKPGCQIVARGTGKDFTSPSDTMRKLIGAFGAQGWQEDTNYVADGPVGTATGIRKNGTLGLLNVGWMPAPEANCPQDQPIDMCELTPEQHLYEITLALPTES
jgi:hypothetical protein